MPDPRRSIVRVLATDTLYGLALSSDGRHLATASWEGAVRVLGLEDGRVLHTLRGHQGRVYSVAFSPDGRALACGGPQQADGFLTTSQRL